MTDDDRLFTRQCWAGVRLAGGCTRGTAPTHIVLLGREQAELLRGLTLSLYRRAAGIAAQAGVVLADTKFEFGLDDEGRLVLADEVLTPDSARFWGVGRMAPRRPSALLRQAVRP